MTSASRQVAYSKMTHKLRVGHREAIIRIMAGSCGHVIMLVLRWEKGHGKEGVIQNYSAKLMPMRSHTA